MEALTTWMSQERDRRDIEETIKRYFRALDTRQPHLLEEVFAPDGKFWVGGVLTRGPGATQETPRDAIKVPGKVIAASHLMSSCIIELSGDTARVETLATAYLAVDERPGRLLVRGPNVMKGYLNPDANAQFKALDGWYDTGDLGYLTENGHVVVCGRVKDVIIMAGRNIYPTDIERAAGRVEGVRAGCAVAVRLDAGHSRETFAVAVESNNWEDPVEVRRIEHQVAHEVVAEVDVRPRNVVVLGPGSIPKTPSGKLRRSTSVSLVIG